MFHYKCYIGESSLNTFYVFFYNREWLIRSKHTIQEDMDKKNENENQTNFAQTWTTVEKVTETEILN